MTTSTAAPNAPHTAPTPGPTGAVIAAVLVTMVAWASAFVAIRGVRDSFDPGALALGRLAVGAVALGAAVLVRRAWVRPTRREWLLVLLCGVGRVDPTHPSHASAHDRDARSAAVSHHSPDNAPHNWADGAAGLASARWLTRSLSPVW